MNIDPLSNPDVDYGDLYGDACDANKIFLEKRKREWQEFLARMNSVGHGYLTPYGRRNSLPPSYERYLQEKSYVYAI